MQVFTLLMMEYDLVRPSDKALSNCNFRNKSVRGYVNLQKRYWQKGPRPRDHPHTCHHTLRKQNFASTCIPLTLPAASISLHFIGALSSTFSTDFANTVVCLHPPKTFYLALSFPVKKCCVRRVNTTSTQRRTRPVWACSPLPTCLQSWDRKAVTMTSMLARLSCPLLLYVFIFCLFSTVF